MTDEPLRPTEQRIREAQARAIAAVEAEDPALAIESCRTLRSALWARDRERQMAAAQRERQAHKAANRELAR